MRAALYARCSTQDQSVDLQVDDLCTYAKARDLRVVEEYLDEGVSGTKAKGVVARTDITERIQGSPGMAAAHAAQVLAVDGASGGAAAASRASRYALTIFTMLS